MFPVILLVIVCSNLMPCKFWSDKTNLYTDVLRMIELIEPETLFTLIYMPRFKTYL